LHDYYTTCTDIDIDRYTHTHTHTTHTHYTHTHTHTYTHNTRSGELRCSRSASYSKKRQTTLQQKCVVQQEAANYVHADLRSREAKEVKPPLRRLHLRYKVAALEARVRVLHSPT
jgi:hypothetical protein